MDVNYDRKRCAKTQGEYNESYDYLNILPYDGQVFHFVYIVYSLLYLLTTQSF